MKNIFSILAIVILISAAASFPAQAAQTIVASKVKEAPVLDGSSSDPQWSSATGITVRDRGVDRDITIKSVHSGDMIFFLVQHADPAEDRLHKPWGWDREMKTYILGPQREDTFTFKWNMEKKEVDLSNFSDDSYMADVWYWKANRTDPAGYADDKHHILTSEPGKKAKELESKSGKKQYLMRVGDKGGPAQKKRILTTYQGDTQDQYESAVPDGSRADVLAKGAWRDGIWTIEFGRKFTTGQTDDIQFEPGGTYLFGVSIAGLYAEPIDKTKTHWYGQGRISEALYLRIE